MALSIAATTMAASGYLLLVRYFRYQRAHQNIFFFNTDNCQSSHAPDDMRRRQLEEYNRIVADISNLEMPLTFRISLEFALFRTFAVPSMSVLLEHTKRFQKDCGKRYDDTDLLLREMFENNIFSERSDTAVRRINAIHGQYQQRIRMDDMRYVLSVFVLEPIRWAERFEWRKLTSVECDALLAVWTHIGQRMGITDIPTTIDEFDRWNQAYEKENMVYAASNTAITEPTIDLFLSILPWWMRSVGRKVAYCLMDERLRSALHYPDPNPALAKFVFALLWIRKIIIRHLMLPRPQWLSARRTPVTNGCIIWKPHSDCTQSNGCTNEIKLFPRYHTYNPVYRDGYYLSKLGDAPQSQLYPDGKCPVYSTP